MNSTLTNPAQTDLDRSVIASYRTHTDAEAAVRSLASGGLSMGKISIIGRNFETHEDVQGFYRPEDAIIEGAGTGAWFGGFFGLMWGAMGMFVIPVVGPLIVLGPLAGLIAGAVGGAGVGALINGLVASGVPRDQALRYQERLQAGEFLVVVHGSASDTHLAHEILETSNPTDLQKHSMATEGSEPMVGMKM